MKPETKRKILFFINDFARKFALYCIMPIILLCMVALFITVNTFGAQTSTEFVSKAQEKSIAMLIGEATASEKSHASYYFPSADISFPARGLKDVFFGDKTYFFTAFREENSPEPVNEDMIIYDSLPAGANPVIKCDLSSNSYYLNQTKYKIDLNKIKASFPIEKIEEGEPSVLIVHTHGTECYLDDNNNLADFAPDGVDGYYVSGEMSHRSTDVSKNVVRIGEVFSEVLIQNKVGVIHCTVMHDKDSYNAAYSNSANTVKEYLKKYPSIKYVIDIHRDSITRDKSLVKTYTETEGQKSAQVMLVVGSDQNGKHPNWEKNLSVASAFKDSLDKLYPSLSRPMYIRTARFNQELSVGSLLLEVGSAANTLEEAETAARFAALAFCDMIRTH